MNHTSKDLERLIELMAKLPGLGPRSARRAVLHMVKKRALIMAPLADVLAEVAKTVRDHGGIIEFESQPKKTSFRLRLPMCPPGTPFDQVDEDLS